jgi:uncharacterized protein YkwD
LPIISTVFTQWQTPYKLEDEALSKIATTRSEDMATNDYFSHTSPDGCDLLCRFKVAHYPSLAMGENLAEFSDYTTQSESKLAEEFVNDWLKSSTHRQNLLSNTFTHEGIGVAVKDTHIVVTVIFANP